MLGDPPINRVQLPQETDGRHAQTKGRVTMLRNTVISSSSAVLFALAVTGAAPLTDRAEAQEELCNPVVDARGEPVLGGQDVVIHGGTYVCPQETAMIEEETDVAEVEPAAAPPEPLPEGGTVYFAFDVAELDQEARSTLDQIIADVVERDLRGVTVAGHADRAGPDAYNVRLSQRRAQNVAAELIKAGIPARVIETRALGESEPAVPTEDGVPLQANRRALIDFAF